MQHPQHDQRPSPPHLPAILTPTRHPPTHDGPHHSSPAGGSMLTGWSLVTRQGMGDWDGEDAPQRLLKSGPFGDMTRRSKDEGIDGARHKSAAALPGPAV